MIFEYDTLNQDTALFLDPIKTLGDIGVTLTEADIEKAEADNTDDGTDTTDTTNGGTGGGTNNGGGQ